MKLFLLIIRHLTNVSLAWFDPIRPQDCIIADQSSALFSMWFVWREWDDRDDRDERCGGKIGGKSILGFPQQFEPLKLVSV
jgi:hypothetical protein